ncbi:uncharacterized protein LOC129947111 [Eupeodes corollae]|uniref:uncharacterized protein LOC129947111 n=1 Tax=Eupeodes corollae TaxID=290404 RepID=UPI00248FD947|nr:uncharacterized protein LOC129947111 [Eupeodes corollae]
MLKFVFSLILYFVAISSAYEIPIATFKIFYPKGFEVSIPADENVTLFAFHGKLNEPLNGLEAGRWSRDILKPIDGRFTFVDDQTSLKLGDRIYYWTFAINNGLGYREDNGVYDVREYAQKNDVYKVPKAEFKIFYPQGFQVSIPAEEKTTLFAFHGKLNEQMRGLEAGKWSKDISQPTNGRYVFEDRVTSFKVGDVIYYWTFVINNGQGYREDDGVYVITEYSLPIESTTTPATTTRLAPIGYTVPRAEFKIFQPQGFEVSIPAEEGVSLFAFHGKLNEKMNGLEAGKWSRDVTTVTNGRFVFADRYTSLKIGDYIYYWTFVIHNGLGYREDDGVFVVSKYSTQRETAPSSYTNKANVAVVGYKTPTTQNVINKEEDETFLVHRFSPQEQPTPHRIDTTVRYKTSTPQIENNRKKYGGALQIRETYQVPISTTTKKPVSISSFRKTNVNKKVSLKDNPAIILASRLTSLNLGRVSSTTEAPARYKVPKAEFRVLHPKGFEVTIPAEEGVSLFEFHGKLNEKMDGLEAGRWSKAITTTKNGKFVFEDRKTSLKPGDIIYYWTLATHNGVGYREDNGEYMVTEYSSQSNVAVSTTTESTPMSYKVPIAQFKIYYPKGFEVSIPADENITLFAFHGKLNEEMEGLEAGRWARDIVKAKYERFTFRERETSLKIGDTIYYWTYVVYNGLGYREDDGIYVVTHYTPQEGNSSASLPPLFSVISSTASPTVLSSSTRRPGECAPSVTTINNGISVPCAGQVIFEENFNGDRVDPVKWSMERRFAFQPDYEFVIYLLNNEVIRIGNGMATLKPVPLTRTYGADILTKEFSLGPNCTGILDTDDCIRTANSLDILPPFISAQFSTKARFSFKHGRVEIRAKMPNAPWVFPQLFLEPVDSRYGAKNYQSGQIRMALSRNNGGDSVDDLFGGVILNANLPYRNVKMCKRTGPPIDWSTDFHLYQVKWLRDRIIFSVDNEEYCSIQPDNGRFSEMQVNGKYLPNREYLKTGSIMAPFDQEFYIRLGYGIGGHNDFPDDASLWLKEKPWTNFHPKSMRQFWNKQKTNWNHWLGPDAALKIDYIRVYSIE